MNRPWVIANMAMTLDGKISTSERLEISISGKEDLQRRDQLRTLVDGVLVGGRTLEVDDPSLIVYDENLVQGRIAAGRSAQPIGIAISKTCNISRDSNFLNCVSDKRIVFTTSLADYQSIQTIKDRANVSVMGEEKVDLPKALHRLSDLGLQTILVEGGGSIMFEMLKHDFIDEFFISVNPIIFGGKDAPTPVDGMGFSKGHYPSPTLKSVSLLNDSTVVIHYTFRNETKV